jgi:hypothetical protein
VMSRMIALRIVHAWQLHKDWSLSKNNTCRLIIYDISVTKHICLSTCSWSIKFKAAYILDLQSIPWELEDNGTAAMLVPNSKEVNEILLLKRDQHHVVHIIGAVAHIIESQEYLN